MHTQQELPGSIDDTLALLSRGDYVAERSLATAVFLALRMVAWLCTEDASFSTGAVFDLSGGRGTY